jgi:hypothetical protein
MSTLKVEQREAKADTVHVTEDTLSVDLLDGRTIAVPLAWFPRLLHGTRKERTNWRLIARGEGIHWPDLDEDVSVEDLLREGLRVKVKLLFKDGSTQERARNHRAGQPRR